MPSTCLRLRVDQLLERTWVSSTDQAPANAIGVYLRRTSIVAPASEASRRIREMRRQLQLLVRLLARSTPFARLGLLRGQSLSAIRLVFRWPQRAPFPERADPLRAPHQF